MKRFYIYIVLCFMFGCSSDDEITSLNEQSFELISYRIETPIDLNNDGVFSDDLIEENSGECLLRRLVFGEEAVSNPFSEAISLFVDIINGNPTQTFVCELLLFGFPSLYILEDNTITIIINDEVQAIGQLSNNTVTFEFSGQKVFSNSIILSQDGSIENYNGNVIATYRLIQ